MNESVRSSKGWEKSCMAGAGGCQWMAEVQVGEMGAPNRNECAAQKLDSCWP